MNFDNWNMNLVLKICAIIGVILTFTGLCLLAWA